jgi:hypothetical protein
LAGRLKLFMEPFATPGDVEIKYATSVGGKTGTLAHWGEALKTAASESANFVECELAAGTETTGAGATNSSALKFSINSTDVQTVIEY